MTARPFITNILGLNGAVEPGGLLQSYVRGTTTPLPLYADIGLTTPLTNPAAADALGQITAYFNDALSYSWQAKTANAATNLWSADVVAGVLSLTYINPAYEVFPLIEASWTVPLAAPLASGWASLFAAAPSTSIREKLTATRNYYVRTDGSDSNTGLANTSGGAFLTIQKAVDVVMKTIDLNNFDVAINVAAGTYTGAVLVDGPWVGSGTVYLIGASITTTIISTTSANAIHVTRGGRLFPYDLKVQTTTGGAGIVADLGGTLNCNAMNFGACAGSQIEAGTLGYIQLSASYKISGNAVSHFHASGEGANITCAAITAQFLSNVTYTSYFAGTNRGSVEASGLTIDLNTFTVTGKKFVCHYNGTIVCSTQAVNYFPGSTVGTLDNGGVYVSNQGAIFDAQVAWQSYSPAVAAGSGTFTSVSATGKYKIDGSICHLNGEVTVTTVGTASSYLTVNTPNLVNPTSIVAVTAMNKDTGGDVPGYIAAGGGAVILFPAVFPTSGQHIVFTVTYETVFP
jgi:hypothetical protein